MKHVTLEICGGSAEDAIEAFHGGADRVELCSALFLGGLTPTLGTLQAVKAACQGEVMAMVRPRAGGFCYTDVEMDVIRRDAALLLANGADGLVFGFLKPDGTVDEERTREMVALCGEKMSVFHRAIDVTLDWRRALETLMRLGVKRVLTSGQAANALFALETIREMRLFAGDAIEILPGAGIRLENAEKVLAATGCDQLHLSCRKVLLDASTAGGHGIHFGGALYPPEDTYEVTDAAYVAALRERLG